MENSITRPLFRISIFALAGVAFLGGFSRFTHGEYTPGWYAFQEYHAEDDGSLTAMITPVMDILLGMMLFVPRLRFGAACVSTLFFAMGLFIQISSSKDYMWDCALVALGLCAIKGAAMGPSA